MSKYINKFIENNISNDLKYCDFKDKINVNQYIVENNKIKIAMKYKFVSLILMFCIFLLSGFLILNANRVKLINNEVILYANDKEWIDAHDYIFVAKVVELTQTKKYDGTGTDIPYSFYKIIIVDYLKGDGEKEGTICFYGGKEYLNTWTLYSSNNEILKTNKYYLFFANKKTVNSVNERIGKNDFIISRNDQKILLSNYEENKDLSNQNENIKLILERFKIIINKETDFDIYVPVYNNIKEIVDNFEYVFIAKIDIDYRTNDILTHIPTVYYNYTILEKFKDQMIYPKKLLYLGVNYWFDEETSPKGIKLPEVDGIYLILANNYDDDLLILANYQQVKLENYNPNYSYQDQSDEIKDVVNEYIKYIEDSIK